MIQRNENNMIHFEVLTLEETHFDEVEWDDLKICFHDFEEGALPVVHI
jgi:hypothetical protein